LGLYNVVAVMDAYRLYYTAQRDFYQARYDYLLNRLKLKQSVGTLSRNDLEDISALIE
jgi:outer membrane protein